MGPPAKTRTTQSALSHEPSPAPHADLSRTGEREGTFVDRDRCWSPRISRAERRRVRWNEHGRRWQQQKAMRACFRSLPPRGAHREPQKKRAARRLSSSRGTSLREVLANIVNRVPRSLILGSLQFSAWRAQWSYDGSARQPAEALSTYRSAGSRLCRFSG